MDRDHSRDDLISTRVETSYDEVLGGYDIGEDLGVYFATLEVENAKVNLVSRETTEAGLLKLAAESLAPFMRFDWSSVRAYLDIGSGGGFPGIPIILGARSVGARWGRSVLVERTAKRAEALGRIAASVGIEAGIVNKTFEDCVFSSDFDLVTLRYIKLTPRLLKRVVGILAEGGLFVYYSWPSFEIDDGALSLERFLFAFEGDRPGRRVTLLLRKAV